jgi:protocatechuate 3,4-dioxygenase beta subunit
MKGLFKYALILGLALAAHARAADSGPPEYYIGTAVDDQGRPVAGAMVDCYYHPSYEGFGSFRYGDDEPELIQRTVTDSNGVFAVLCAPGATLAVVKKAGLATAWKTWSSRYPDSSEPVVLTAPTALAGTVLDESNQPVAGAEVWVTEAAIGNGYSMAEQENQLLGKPARECFSARTGADGRFRIGNFPAGGHAGLAVKVAGKAQRPSGSVFGGTREHRSGDEDIELTVGPAGAVEGRVAVAETGQPLAGIKIKLQGTESGLYGSAYREPVESDADGAFRILDVQPGTYTVRASIPAQPVPDWVMLQEFPSVTVVAGETARDVTLHATKGALVEVSVVTTNELMPVVGALVSSPSGIGYTGINGMALFRVPAGNGKEYFSARKDWFSQNRQVAIEAGHVNNVWIELIPPPTITGTVRDPAGAPVAGALVSFHPGVYPDAPDYSEVTADKDGRYEISLKLSREYMAWEGPITPTNYILARDPGRNLAAIQPFKEIPASLDLVLQPGITFSGSVEDTNGAPVTNATLDLRFETAWSSGQVGPPPFKVNAQGEFTIPAMPQGWRYSCFEGITAKGYGSVGAFLDAAKTKTNHYEFPPFVLKRADRKLAGQVLGVDGKPVLGANVSFSGQGQPDRANTQSERNGRFVFDTVCEGPVSVNASYTTQEPSLPAPPGAAGPPRNIPRYTTIQGRASAQGGDTNIVIHLGVNNYAQNSLPTRKITGTVRDPSGAPAAGVTMSLSYIQVRNATNQTDSDGRYEFNWQESPSVNLTNWLLARDLKRNLVALHQVVKSTTNLDLTLQEGLTLSTQVKNSDGQPVTNLISAVSAFPFPSQANNSDGQPVANATVTVTLWPEPNRGFALNPQPALKYDGGHLHLDALPQGMKYTIQINAPGYFHTLNVTEEDTKTNFLELPPCVIEPASRNAANSGPSRAYFVSGRVLDADGKPAPSVPLELVLPGPSRSTTQKTTTDSDGSFAFVGVTPLPVIINAGPVHVNGGAQTWFGNVQTTAGDTNVVIRLGLNDNRYMPSVEVTTSGTVFDPSGVPDPGVSLSAISSEFGTSFGFDRSNKSDAGGKYEIQWGTRAGRTNDAGRVVLYATDPARNLAATIELDPTATNLDLHLRTGLTLSGAVRDTEGNPITNVVMILVPYPPDDLRAGMNRQPPANADAQGLFSFSGLPQDVPYALLASAPGYGSNNILVPAGATQTNQLQLPVVLKTANRQVAGHVIDPDGRPCWGAQMGIEAGEGQPSGHPGSSGSDGRFVIKDVCDGLLDVRAMLPAGSGYPRFLVGIAQGHGGDTNIVIHLGLSNGVPFSGPGGLGPVPATRPPSAAPLQP